MEWYMWLLLAPAPVLFFWCCCGACGYFHERFLSLSQWTQVSGTWTVGSGTFPIWRYFETSDSNAVLRANVVQSHPNNAYLVTVTIENDGDEARLYTSYTSSSDNAYYKIVKDSAAGVYRVSFVATIGGVETPHDESLTKHPDTPESGSSYSTLFRICYSDRQPLVPGLVLDEHFAWGTGTVTGYVRFSGNSVDTSANVFPWKTTGADDPTYQCGVENECLTCEWCNDACDDVDLMDVISVEVSIDSSAFPLSVMSECQQDSMWGVFVLDRIESDRPWDAGCNSSDRTASLCTFVYQDTIECVPMPSALLCDNEPIERTIVLTVTNSNGVRTVECWIMWNGYVSPTNSACAAERRFYVTDACGDGWPCTTPQTLTYSGISPVDYRNCTRQPYESLVTGTITWMA